MSGESPSQAMLAARYDDLFREASRQVLDGTHTRDQPPVEGGRWPVSAYLVPPEPVADQLAIWCDHAAAFAGPRHFHTGSRGSAHVTVRALEMRREAGAADPFYRRCAHALTRAAHRTVPLRFRLTGLGLTSIAVIATFVPADDAADEFRRHTLGAELGDDADACEGPISKRDIWHASVLHFTDDIADQVGLVDWVSSQRRLDSSPEFTFNQITLGRFDQRAGERPTMWPTALAAADFGTGLTSPD